MRYSTVIILSLCLSACTKIEVPKETPKCVKNEIKSFSKSLCSEGIKVEEYKFMGERVFAFFECSGPDSGIRVINENCENIGYLNGFSGNVYINGVVFFYEAEYVKTIWKN